MPQKDDTLRFRFSFREIGVPAALLALWALTMAALASGLREVRLSDAPSFFERAANLHFPPVLEELVHAFYPWGYPAALRWVATGTVDYLRAMQVLSLLGGAVTLGAVWIVARAGFGWPAALAATALLATSFDFNRVALEGATDLPAVAWMYLAVAALAIYRQDRSARWAAAAGGALGVAYLVRYTTLPFLLIGLAFIGALPGLPLRRRFAHGAALGVTFLLASAPQWIPTALVRGNPFWNRQDANVYFFALGHGDWGQGWTEANDRANGIVEVVVHHPRAVFDNVARNLVALPRVFRSCAISLLAIGGAMMLRRCRDSKAVAIGALLLAAALAFALALCLTTVYARVAIPILPALAALAGFGLTRLLRPALESARLRAATLATAILVLGACAALDFRALWRGSRPSHLGAVSDALQADGLIDAGEVLSFDDSYADLGSAEKTLFARPWLAPESFRPRSMDDVIRRLRQQEMRYLVVNDPARARLEKLGTFQLPVEAPEEFREIYRGSAAPHAQVWRLRSDE